MSMRITGDKKFMDELRKRRGRAREAARIGVNSGAHIIVNAAKEKAPVRTGNLKRSIHVEPSGKAKVEGDKIYSDVGTDEIYAAAQEYGRDPYMIDSPVLMDVGWRHIKMHPGLTAQPYMRPAMDENKDEYNKEVATTIRKVWIK